MSEILVNTIKKADGTGSITVPAETGTVLTSGGAIDVNASAPADSLAIDSSGRIGVNTTSPSDFAVNIVRGSGMGTEPTWESTSNRNIALLETDQSEGYLVMGAPTNGFSQLSFADAGSKAAGGIGYSHSNNTLRLRANGDDKVRIDSDGALLILTTSQNRENCNFQVNNRSAGLSTGVMNSDYGSDYNAFTFYRASSSSSGSIRVGGSSVSYNTSSDYRLKENVVDMTGAITRVKSLAPKRFNFIADTDDTTVDGFLAHEAQSVVPEAVTGTHDEVDDDGNAVMQGIDQAKLVPLLTGALKEAIAKIETLETTVSDLQTRVTALEGA